MVHIEFERETENEEKQKNERETENEEKQKNERMINLLYCITKS